MSLHLVLNALKPKHGIIGVHRAPLKILGPPPLDLGPHLDMKASGLPLIYLVGPLAITVPQINICVEPLTLAFIVSKWMPYLLPPPPLF